MKEVKRIKALKGEFTPPIDREMAFTFMVSAIFARGTSEIEKYPTLGSDYSLFLQWLEILELTTSFEDETLIIDGQGSGFIPVFNDELTLSQSSGANALMLALLLQNPENKITLKGEPHQIIPLANLAKSSKAFSIEKNQVTILPPPQLKSYQEFTLCDPNLRNYLLLRHLLANSTFEWKEPYSIRDHFVHSLAYFGNDVKVQKNNAQEMDELQRRLARIRGIKTERSSVTSFSPNRMKAKKGVLPSDCLYSACLALLATLIPSSEIIIHKVIQNPSRSGFFTGIRRLGANSDTLKRKEKAGEATANLKVKYAKELNARKLSGEIIQTGFEEFPLMAIAACFSEGESILRDLDSMRYPDEDLLRELATMLRTAGIETGEFQDGLVLRGRTECDSGLFRGHGHPGLSLAAFAMALSCHGNSQLQDTEIIDSLFPQLSSSLLPS